MAKEDYILKQTGEQVQKAIDDALALAPATVETPGLMSASDKTKLNSLPTGASLESSLGGKVDKVTGKGLSTNDYDNSEKSKVASAYQKPNTGIPKEDLSDGVKASLVNADSASQDVTDIKAKIPSQASDQNQLADKNFVNSSIATATADFKGTYDSLSELQAVTADKNDYGYVVSTDQAGNTVYSRYKYDGSAWVFEYELNNSSFTAAEWASIQSQITSALVQKLSALPTNQELSQSLSGKQDIIPDLTTIRSGANAGATAYQKPASGIPASDLAEGVIPEAQTDLVKYSTQSLTDAQKMQARTNIGAASEEELDAISRGEYVEAWDGVSEPVVADIPSGVQVEYNSQMFTGTLAASNDTLGKIYLIGTGVTDEYNRYRTSRSGVEGSYTYSWVPFGSTQMNLSGFATKNEVSQLQQEVDEKLDAVAEESPEFLRVYTDADGKILWAIKADGTVMAAAGFEVHGAVLLEGEDINVIDNPEFVYVRLDKEGKVLYGVQKDGNIIFGCGVPSQIVSYIEERISDLSIDEYEDIVSFLGGLIDGEKTLQSLLDDKVDKETGKSLINSNYAETKNIIESPEFLEVTTDNENKIIEGTQQNGTKIFGSNVKVLGNMEISGIHYTVIENPEYLAAWVDLQNKVLFGIKTDGKFFIPDADFLRELDKIKAFAERISAFDIHWDALPAFSLIDGKDYINIETDNEGKILSSRDKDGEKKEYIGFDAPKISINGSSVTNIEDPEGRTEIKTDGEGKIISYRDGTGVKHEEVGLITKQIIAGRIDAEHIEGVKKEITEEENLYFERPKFAEIDFTGALPTDTSDARIPTTPIVEFKVNGETLFKSNCELSIQGHGSALFTKKGYTLDFKNKYGDELSVKFGDMISVDSYHLKGYYTDRTQARAIGCARLWRDMVKHLPYPYNKVNNKPLDISNGQKADSIWTADARYSEDGFPCSVYVNGDFCGLYTLKLKKNRKNYAMEKSKKSEIFIDSLGYEEREGHSAKLSDPFDYASWDLKNPKLSNYSEGGEITDATVLASIERLFTFTNNFPTMYSQYEDYIVLPHWICWVILSELIANIDANGNNYELLTWDGTHWSILPYDMDNTLGILNWDLHIDTVGSGFKINFDIYQTFKTVFDTEIKNIYTMLRKCGFINVDNLYSFFVEQTNSIPRNIYDMDVKKWPNTIYEGDFTTLEQIYFYLQSRIEFLDNEWLLNS